jgi:DNA-binding CsgD family transcriptional regulator
MRMVRLMLSLPMVGRSRELAEIGHAWPAARGTVLVTGDAGAGKSMLVRAALDHLDPAPATVLFGRARLHSPAPDDWLAGVLCHRPTEDLPVPADALAWLAQQPEAPARRYAPEALLRLAVRTVRALVGDGPAVVVVEDLHALDPASLNLVAELATTPALPAVLLVTSRPASDPATSGLAAPVSPEVAGSLRERSGGNPYQLTELLVQWQGAGFPAPAGDRGELTAREREVLACLAEGMTNQQVATALGISSRTVAVHVSNLLRKTSSASRTEAALWGVRHHLVAL